MAARFVVTFKFEKKASRDRPEITLERSRVLVGSRPTADVHIPDRLVPLEAFDLVFDGRRLQIEVKGRLAGVFVDGAPVEGNGPVPHGAAIQCGASLLEVSIDEANSVCKLVAGDKYLTASVAAAAKKAGQPFALEHDGPQEQRWGRSNVLRTWNWAAAFAGILLLASFPFVRDGEAVNRGTLTRAHTIGTEKGPKDCAACHAPFASNYGPLCAKCHEGLDSESHHPYARAAEFTCQHCHGEHRGADADPLPPAATGSSGWPKTCESCHAGRDREQTMKEALAQPDLASRARDRAGEPVQRWLRIDGFSHADHRVAKQRRASLAGGTKAPDGDVPVACARCHERRAAADGRPGATPDADFALVPYTKCLDCHAEWRVDVHGREQGGVHCFQCHAKTDDPSKVARDIRTTEVAATGSLYDLPPRRHDFAKDDCRTCHAEAKPAAAPSKPVRLAFRHDHHLRTVAPQKGGGLDLAASCVPCHSPVAESASLAGLGSTLAAVKLDSCKDCHTDGAPTPVPAASTRKVVDMFHSVHTVEPGTSGSTLRALANRDSIALGCLSCHVPSEGAKPMTLREGVADCTACHKGHESLGGGKCALCHVDRQAPENRDAKGQTLYRRNEAGIFAQEKAVTKASPAVKGFLHFSRGHAPESSDATGGGCAKCHSADAVNGAQRIVDVQWPGATDRACLECHVRERYHR